MRFDRAPSDTAASPQLLCVFERLETRIPASRVDPRDTSSATLLYARITLTGFVCPQRLALDQCERRAVVPVPGDPATSATTALSCVADAGAAAQYTVFLVPRIDIVYNPLAAIGSASALDAHLVPKPKHAGGRARDEDRLRESVDSYCDTSQDDGDDWASGPDFDFFPNSADEDDAAVAPDVDDPDVVVLHSDSTSGTVHDDEDADTDDVMRVDSHDKLEAYDDAAPSAASQAAPAPSRAKPSASRKRARPTKAGATTAASTAPPRPRKRRPVETRTVDVLRQTFGSVRQDTGLRLPPSVETLQRSARSKRYAKQWNTSIDTRALLKHLDRWLTCIAGAARSRSVVMSRLLQRVDQFQTDEPFLDALALAVLCTAVCRDASLATTFMNTYGDLVQCQVSGVVGNERQRDIMWRYKCDVHAPPTETQSDRRPPAWHVRVRNAVVRQVGMVIRDYNSHSKIHGDVVHDSVFRCAVNAARDYLQHEAQPVRRPSQSSAPTATAVGVKRGARDAADGAAAKRPMRS
jgi:hypothetical protein